MAKDTVYEVRADQTIGDSPQELLYRAKEVKEKEASLGSDSGVHREETSIGNARTIKGLAGIIVEHSGADIRLGISSGEYAFDIRQIRPSDTCIRAYPLRHLGEPDIEGHNVLIIRALLPEEQQELTTRIYHALRAREATRLEVRIGQLADSKP